MPLYEYECKKCGHRFEKIQKFSDRMVKKCPECGGELTERDKLGAHLRDELGIDPHRLARPLQAAWISALSFATFALLPILGLRGIF